MEVAALAVVALVAIAVGAVVGFVARQFWANQAIKAAQEKAARIVAEARTQQKDLILEAKDEKLRLGREAEEEARQKRTELSALERRLLQRDEQLDQRTDMLEQRDRKLLERERELDRAREETARLRQEQVAVLERVSSLSADDAKAMLLEAVREDAEQDAVRLTRAIEREARDNAGEKARDVIVTAMQRVAADHTAEHTVTAVHLPSDEMKGRIIGREGRNIRALEQATGVDLIIDDTPETVVLSGFDPVRREVARVALTKLIAGRPDPPRPDRGGRRQGPRRGRPGHPPGGRAGGVRRGRPRPPAGPHQAPRPPPVPHELRPERPAALPRDEPPLGDHRGRARRGRDGGEDGRPPARPRQGRGPRGRGAARGDRRADRAAPQPPVQGRERHRRAPPGGRVRLRRGADRPGRRRDQRVAARRPRRVHRDVRQAPRGAPGDRRRASPASTARSPSRRGARSGSSSVPTRSTTWRPAGSRATS